MPWVKVDDRLPGHRKVQEIDNDAFALLIASWCYCADNLTDGHVTRRAAESLARLRNVPYAAFDQLAGVGLWERSGDGFVVHDYLEYNPSREQVMKEREDTARRQAEWRKRQDLISNGVSNAVTNGQQTPAPYPYPSPSPSPVFDPVRKETLAADAAPVAPTGAPDSEPSPRERKPSGPSYSTDFETFWRRYPRKVEKPAAWLQWQKRTKEGADPTEMIAAAENFADLMRAEAREQTYVMYATTFLGKNKRWLGYITPTQALVDLTPPRPAPNGRPTKYDASKANLDEVFGRRA